MDTYTSRYGIIDYKTVAWESIRCFGEFGMPNDARNRMIQYTKWIQVFKSDVARWFIYTYDITDLKTYDQYNNQQTRNEINITRYFIDNYLNLYTQRITKSPGCYRCSEHRDDIYKTSQNMLDSPLTDDIIDKIKKEWYLPKDSYSLICVLHTYVKLYMETKTHKEELRLASLPPSKKFVDEEIAELQTRIMELYAEKGKN
jgi:hypothetical protein